MKIKFTKMHGCGNDYVYINGFSEKINKEDKPEFVKKVSDRHFGIGSDGVIFINPSDIADFEMEMFNADGTRAEMCGNGIRSVAKYVYDRHLTDKEEMTIESMGKVKYITVFPENGKAKHIKVDMGEPILKASDIPVVSNEEKVIDEIIFVDDKEYRMTCVSMGNPHAVALLRQEDEWPVLTAGPLLEKAEEFPGGTNVEFVKVLDRKSISMRVWERGVGETLACGSGACAAAAVCMQKGLTDDEITVTLLGGELKVYRQPSTGRYFLTGQAVTVFEGVT